MLKHSRQTEEIIGIISMSKNHESSETMMRVLGLNKKHFIKVFEQMPTLPKPHDYHKLLED